MVSINDCPFPQKKCQGERLITRGRYRDMKKIPEQEIINGEFSYEELYDICYDRFYSDVYDAHIWVDTEYIDDLHFMNKIERLNIGKYRGLYADVAYHVLHHATDSARTTMTPIVEQYKPVMV